MDFYIKYMCSTERQNDGSVYLKLNMRLVFKCVLWCLDFMGREIRWVLGAFKGEFSCCVGLVVRATIQTDGSVDFRSLSDGDRGVVDLNILQTAKK